MDPQDQWGYFHDSLCTSRDEARRFRQMKRQATRWPLEQYRIVRLLRAGGGAMSKPQCKTCDFCEPRKFRCRKLESLPMVGEHLDAGTCPEWCPLLTPSLAALEQAVEEAWDKARPHDIMDEIHGTYRLTEEEHAKLLTAVGAWLAARRIAREAGMVSVQLHRDLLVQIGKWWAKTSAQARADEEPSDEDKTHMLMVGGTLLALLCGADLADVLKETP